jgi:hypothetical protein
VEADETKVRCLIMLAQVEPLSAEILKQIQDLDPIEKPDHRERGDDPGSSRARKPSHA